MAPPRRAGRLQLEQRRLSTSFVDDGGAGRSIALRENWPSENAHPAWDGARAGGHAIKGPVFFRFKATL